MVHKIPTRRVTRCCKLLITCALYSCRLGVSSTMQQPGGTRRLGARCCPSRVGGGAQPLKSFLESFFGAWEEERRS